MYWWIYKYTYNVIQNVIFPLQCMIHLFESTKIFIDLRKWKKSISNRLNYKKRCYFVLQCVKTISRERKRESSFCQNKVFSLTHWFLRSTKQQHAIHSHVFHLYSAGENGTASDVSCWRAPKNLFYFSVVVPACGVFPRSIETDLNASYVFANTPATLFSESVVDKHSSLRARHDFHPSANKKSRVSSTGNRRRQIRHARK